MKKGFTLVELVAVLTILAIIALIVTPNIMVSISEYKEQAYESQIQAIEGAAKNWLADNIDALTPPENSNSITALYLPLSVLTENGYFEEHVRDTKNGGKFDDNDHNTYVIITCEYITDEFNIKSDNYRYTYGAYTSKEEYIEKAVIQYAKDHKGTYNTQQTLGEHDIDQTELINGHYIASNNIRIYNSDQDEPVQTFNPFSGISTIKLVVTRTGRSEATYEYSYSATIN